MDAFRWRVSQDRYHDLRQDISEARRLHEALFPEPIADGPVRFSWMYEPMREIGGDYVFAHQKSDGALLVILIDVAGHGVASAFAAGRLHGELERIIEDHAGSGPRDVLMALNRYVGRSLAPQAVYASAVAMELGPDGTFRYASAGHPGILVRRASGAVEKHDATATILGVLDAATFDPKEETLSIARYEGVVAYTDGLVEASDPRGEFFGLDRVVSIVGDAAVSGVDRVIPALLEAVRRHRPGQPADDIFVAALWRAR